MRSEDVPDILLVEEVHGRATAMTVTFFVWVAGFVLFFVVARFLWDLCRNFGTDNAASKRTPPIPSPTNGRRNRVETNSNYSGSGSGFGSHGHHKERTPSRESIAHRYETRSVSGHSDSVGNKSPDWGIRQRRNEQQTPTPVIIPNANFGLGNTVQSFG